MEVVVEVVVEGSTAAALSCVPSEVMTAEGTVGTLLRLPCVSDTPMAGETNRSPH